MRKLIALAMVFTVSPVFAIDIEFFGISRGGEKALITEGAYYLQEQNNGRVVFTGPAKYGFCEPSAGDIEGEYVLRCSSEIGLKPSLVYKSDKNNLKAYSRKAKEIYKRYFYDKTDNENLGRDFGGYYRCVQGCRAEFADVLVKLVYRH
jgi:hypothetical protein